MRQFTSNWYIYSSLLPEKKDKTRKTFLKKSNRDLNLLKKLLATNLMCAHFLEILWEYSILRQGLLGVLRILYIVSGGACLEPFCVLTTSEPIKKAKDWEATKTLF